MKEPRPSLEWQITSKCNYRCPYCCQARGDDNTAFGKHCSDKSVDSVLKLIAELPGCWLVKLIGGEPLIHPRFFEMCERITVCGHELCTTTNFSLPLSEFQRLIDICGEKLLTITTSLHTSQVKSIDEFIDKATEFNSKKNSRTSFSVTSVLIEEDFEKLKEIERRLTEKEVAFKYQVLKSGAKYFKYNAETEEYISNKLDSNIETIRDRNFFGTLCHTGELFFRVDIDGEALRCYNAQSCSYLGNIVKGTFRRFSEVKPCLAKRCSCTVPANRNMICYGQSASNSEIIKTYIKGRLSNFIFRSSRLLTKPFKKIVTRFQ
jgi:MoaA/NifB/PqqE/SkfB family radical SAM enzyme